jgi:hypothetical protein
MNAFGRIGLCLAATGLAASLAGCTASSMGTQPAIQSQPSNAALPNTTLQQTEGATNGGEVLVSNKATLKSQNCGSNISRTTFATNGTATGIYPGTFSAAGQWGIRSSSPAWYFSEGFTVASPPYNISGSIFQRRVGLPTLLSCYSLFRTAHFAYTATVTKQGKLVKQISGTATVFEINKGAFHERLDQ